MWALRPTACSFLLACSACTMCFMSHFCTALPVGVMDRRWPHQSLLTVRPSGKWSNWCAIVFPGESVSTLSGIVVLI